MRLIRNILLLALLLSGFEAFAQSNSLGSENIPNNKQFDWKSIASPSFDIYYYAGDPQMAAVAAKMAEEGLWDICQALDYANKSRFSIYIYLRPEDFAQSNAYPSPNFKDNGLTPLYSNSANILFPGNYQAFRGKVRAAVSKVLMEDYYFGGTIQNSIQNTVLLSMPDWYADGLPSFMGEGWNYEDEFWLAGLAKADMLDIALDGEGPIHRVARKSIWLYITDTYGPEKLGEIFYMTRLTRSVEDGVIHVLGITLKTLTDRWREYVHQKLADNSNFREQLEPFAKQAQLPANERLLSFAQHPREAKAAVFLERKGKNKLAIYDFNKKTLVETAVEDGFKTEQLGTMRLERPIAWKPDGSQLVTITHYKGLDYLAWYTPMSGSVKYSKISPSLDRIYQIAWSPSGEHLVCSGLRMGSIDLYRFGPETANFVPLTNDFYDDLNPVWSQDGQRIYFASTRPNEAKENVSFDANRSGYDIWAFEMEGESLSQITHSPLYNEFPIGMQSSFELLVNSDQTGLYNLQKVNVFLGDSSYVSNHFPGTFRPSYSDSFMSYATSFEGKMVLWSVKTSDALLPQVATRSMWRQKQDKAIMMAKQKADLTATLDSIRKANANLPKPDLEQPAADSAKETKTVKYYVFDDDEDQGKERKRPRHSTSSYVPKAEPAKPDFNQVELKGPSRTGPTWVADRITTRFSYDPVFKLSFLGESRLRDLEGNYQFVMGFRPYVDFKSADAYIGFLNQANKIDYGLKITRSTRYLSKLDFGSRYNATRLDFDGSLPFNRFWSLGAGSHLALLERRNVTLQFPRDVDGAEFVAGANVNLRYDHRKMNGNFTTKGSYANFKIQAVNSISQDSNRFATASFDLRKYIPVKKFVLATRLQGAWSMGSMPQRFFLGGVDEALFSRFSNPADFPIESAQLPSFHYMEYVTPIRGFRFNGRNGTKYVAANAELRIPASRVFRNFLNTNPLYSLELIPFFDFGTTWTTGNPLSQKNPIETQVVNSYPLAITVQTLKSPFLMGFGAGARLQVFGYSTRIDLAWGVDDYTILSPKLHLSLGKNF